MKATGQIT